MELPTGRGLGLVLAAFIFLIILQDLQNNDSSNAPLIQKTPEEEKHAFTILNRSSYKDFDPKSSKWINITGLREDDKLSWYILPEVQEIVKTQALAVLATGEIQTGSGGTHRLISGELGGKYESLELIDDLNSESTTIPFYQNITGLVRGDWFRHILQHAPVPNIRSSKRYSHDDFVRNITSSRGHLHLRLEEWPSTSIKIKESMARDLKGTLMIEESSGESWDISMNGVHFLDSGSAILTTTSDRFSGLFALPHLTRSIGHFHLARELLNQTLRHKPSNNQLDDTKLSLVDDEQTEMFRPSQCDYIVYLQQHLVWPYGIDIPEFPNGQQASYLEMIESELRRPSGRTFNYIPSLRFSATIFSPDCGFILESNSSPVPWYHLTGQKVEVILARVENHVIMYGVIVLIQVLLLTRQIKDSSTPSTQGRISYCTIGMMVMADGGAVATSLFFSAFVSGGYLAIISVSFLLTLSVPFFGLKFLIDIWSAQAPEREEAERRHTLTHTQEPTNNILIITPAGADLLPLPVTSRRHPSNELSQVILPPDQDIDAMLAEDDLLHSGSSGIQTGDSQHERFNLGLKFLLLSFSLTILSYTASYWPLKLRSAYTNLLIFCYLSFWTPQTYRNMTRNCRKALRWEFVLGQSIARLIPIGYFYLYTDNVLSIRTDPYIFMGFVAWLWAQILLLLSQDILGPRFWIPAGILPPVYDYHQILREGDDDDDKEVDGLMPIGSSDQNEEGKRKKDRVWRFECVVCMQTLEVAYLSRQDHSQGIADIFARREYMITPCRHIFHSECLEGWMRYKLQCPICRETLPLA